jgi:hypothetical protein
MGKHPLWVEVFRKSMDARGLTSYDQLARDLSEAGYRPGRSGKLYRTKISGFLHRNQGGPPDDFWYWLD